MAETETTPKQTVGLLAEFEDVDALKTAAKGIRDAGFKHWDVHSPFPVHGIERAMGMRATTLPWLVLLGGLTGAAVALLMQWWMNAINYPITISGKPLFSLPANIPVTFELIILLSAFAAFGGAMGLNRLPEYSHFVLRSEHIGKITTDGFFISIAATDEKFDEAKTQKLLDSLGTTGVEVCRDDGAGGKMPGVVVGLLAIGISLALLPPLLIAMARGQKSDEPRIHLVSDMDFQPKYKPQAYSPLFEDHRTMRPPVPGAIAEGRADIDEAFLTGKRGEEWLVDLPIDVNGATMLRGQEQFDIYCATCHGLGGEGNGMTSLRALKRQDPDWVPPVSLVGGAVREQPVGQIYNTITNGIRSMPSYASQIPPEDRWTIVLYVRALQRSQNATIEDVPEDMRPQVR